MRSRGSSWLEEHMFSMILLLSYNNKNTYLIKFQRWQGSVATIMEDKNSNMYGIVWELQKEHLKTLDEQEGVPHNVYKRINVQVNNTYTYIL